MRTRLLLIALAALPAACSRPQPPVTPPAPPVVVVTTPTVREVVEYLDFTGRARASDVTDLKARVTGYLTAIHFRDGDRVTAGQPLFDLDPGLYATELARAEAAVKQAGVAVKQAEATVVQAKAKLSRVTKDYLRVKTLTTASQSERDQTEGDYEEAKAGVQVAEAAEQVAVAGVQVTERQLAQAKKNMEYTRIVAPKAGRIGRHMLDIGGLVKADDTLLATLVVADPIWVFFDVDDRSDLRLRQLMAEGKLDLSPGGKSRVGVGLPDRDEFTLSGPVRFIDTQINPGTGTTTLRADVDNPKGLLTPGLFVRVRLPIDDPKPGVLVPEEAIGTDQGLKFVYTLNAKDEAVYRPVKPGLAYGHLRVVEPVPGKPDSGVSESDRVIVEGLQRVRKGQKVTVKGPPAGGSAGGSPVVSKDGPPPKPAPPTSPDGHATGGR